MNKLASDSLTLVGACVGTFIAGLVTATMLRPTPKPSPIPATPVAAPSQPAPVNTAPIFEDRLPETSSDEESDVDSDAEPYKLVLVVRNDLKMGKGKAAAQCSHATLGAYKSAKKNDPKGLRHWEHSGQAKVVVKVESEEEMNAVKEKAKAAGLTNHVVMDAGRTQVKSGSRTVLAVGPGPVHLVDEVTGGLKLY